MSPESVASFGVLVKVCVPPHVLGVVVPKASERGEPAVARAESGESAGTGERPTNHVAERQVPSIAKQPVLMLRPRPKVEVAVVLMLMVSAPVLPRERSEPGEVVPMPTLPLLLSDMIVASVEVLRREILSCVSELLSAAYFCSPKVACSRCVGAFSAFSKLRMSSLAMSAAPDTCVPFTCNLNAGAVTLIPTFPLPRITRRSFVPSAVELEIANLLFDTSYPIVHFFVSPDAPENPIAAFVVE